MNISTASTGTGDMQDAGCSALTDDSAADAGTPPESTSAVMPPRSRMARMSAEAARACVRIAREGAQRRVTLAPAQGSEAQPITWRLSLEPDPSAAVRHGASLKVLLDWAGGRMLVGLPPTLCDVWLGARLPGLDVSGLSASLRRAALNTIVQDVTRALDARGPSAPLRVLATGGSEVAAPELAAPDPAGADVTPAWSHAWALRITPESESGGDDYFATLDADDLALARVAALLPPLGDTPARANGVALLDVPVRVFALIGQTVMPLASLRTLAPGDIVLVEEDFGARAGVMVLSTLDGQGIRMRRGTHAEGQSFTATSTWMKLMTIAGSDFNEGAGELDHARAMQDSHHQGAGLDEGGDASFIADSIPVRVTFDAGGCTLTLAELRRLQPGEVMDLDVPAQAGLLRICVNGKQIGAGEMVDVDGRVGVRVLRLGEAQ